MKNNLKILIVTLIILIIMPINSIASIQYFKNESVGIIAYKEITATNITLSDGQIITDVSIKTDSDIAFEEFNLPVEICFIVDASGSMSNKLSQTKKTYKDLVSKLFDLNMQSLKIGLVFFTNVGKPLHNLSFPLSSDERAVLKYIDDLKAQGSTYMNDALITAKNMLKDVDEDQSCKKIIITLSDGLLNDEDDSISTIIDCHKNNISTISIFVDTPITQAFTNLKISNDALHDNYQTNTANLSTIADKVYENIYKLLLKFIDPTREYKMNNAFISDDEIVITLDNELIHGATLQIEYAISIITIFDCNYVRIDDMFSNNLIYNSSHVLLTSNKTNEDYGWKYEDGSLYLEKSGNQSIKAGEKFTVNLVLSTVMTPTNINDAVFRNCFKFKLTNQNTNTSLICNSYINALNVMILPPFAKTNNIALYVYVLLICLSVLLVILVKSKKN